ncbi:hypothetical protein [Thiocystis violacea]|uniref:hypothetical protein n=1 Tax=Thiocystis violacea TaxID=13725 RepID=UPI001907C4CA|nr:hypothetical protein [Thiocystis violacea]
MTTKTHTLSCKNFHPSARPWKLYGHSASRVEHVADVAVKLEDLVDPLSRFLAEHAPQWLAGGHINHDRASRIRCWNGRSEADMVISECKPYAENLIKIYGLDTVPCQVSDWRLPQVDKADDGVSFWTRAANQMRGAGTEMVRIGEAVFFV